MTERKITITGAGGLFGRAASNLVKTAEQFSGTTKVMVVRGTMQANARSLLGILALGAKEGTEVTITADGGDEQKAVDAIASLLENAD